MRKYTYILLIALTAIVTYWLVYRFNTPSLSRSELAQLEQLKCFVTTSTMLMSGQHVTIYHLAQHSEFNVPAICNLLAKANLERVDDILLTNRSGMDHPDLLRLLARSKPVTFQLSHCTATDYRQVLSAIHPERLQALTLHGESVNDELVQLILERFPLLEAIYLVKTDVSDNCVDTISRFQKVKNLTIQSKRLTRAFLDRWKPTQMFTTLYLDIPDEVSMQQLSHVATHVTGVLNLDGMRLKRTTSEASTSKVMLDQLYLASGNITTGALVELFENFTVGRRLALWMPWEGGDPDAGTAKTIGFKELAIDAGSSSLLNALVQVLPTCKSAHVIVISCHAGNAGVANQYKKLFEAKGYQVVLERHGL